MTGESGAAIGATVRYTEPTVAASWRRADGTGWSAAPN